MKKATIWLTLVLFGVSLMAAGCGSYGKTGKEASGAVTTVSGLSYTDVKIGDGETAVAGTEVEVHYTGWLYVDGQKTTKFDSSRDRGELFKFQLGAGRVIKGWDEGVQGMKVGGIRELIIPPAIGYGARGAGGAIPPNATLFFEVELFNVIKK